MSLKFFLKVALSLLIFAIPRQCYGDTLSAISLPKETKLTGKTLELKNNIVSFLCDDGSIANVRWIDITSLCIEDNMFVTLSSDETTFGLVSVKDGKVHVDSQSLGRINLNPHKIVAIQRKRKGLDPVFSVSSTSELANMRAKGTDKPAHFNLEEKQEDKQYNKQNAKEINPKQEEKPKTIGEKPSDRIPEEMFLREEKVLVPKGKGEVELNLTYVNRDRSAPLLGPDKVRSLIPSITARYGVTNKLLGLVTVPFVVNWREIQEDIGQSSRNFRNAGLGDISFGINYQLFSEGYRNPSLMLSLIAKSDTGKPSFLIPDQREQIGTGHWTLSPGISIVRTIDPVVLFGSLYYTYVFEKNITVESEPLLIKPGDSINLILGTGFAFNEKVTLSFKVLGSFIFRDKINNIDAGELKTPFYFFSVLDYMLFKHGYIEPSVAFGITKDATDFLLSISYVHRFY